MNVSDLKIHHFGVAVASIDEAAKSYVADGYKIGEKYFDPQQKVTVCFAEKPDQIPFEMIEPAAADSPVTEILAKSNGEPQVYHVCYVVADMDGVIAALRKQSWVLVKPPLPAVAFGGERVAFLYSRTAGVIELLESKS
ncbi:MAG: VOC family protein [Opitutae bacterium]|nr:VOC family protein [Opitutae bacterium]MCD8298494.1 VOC family protein [Opitutae bacterium]